MEDNNKLFDKLEKLDDKIDKINTVLERNTLSLEIHEKRTTLAETRIVKLEEQALFIQHTIRILASIAAASGVILTVIEIVRALKS